MDDRNMHMNYLNLVMSADYRQSLILRSFKNWAGHFIVKPPTPEDLKNLWLFVVSRKKGKTAIVEDENPKNGNGISGKKSIHHDTQPIPSTQDRDQPSSSNPQKRKSLGEEEDGEEKIDDKIISGNPKKPKMAWTTSLHNKFLDAMHVLGLDRAVPKKILEYMNVPGLTRENVASHLQKYRIYLRRVREASAAMQGGITGNNWNDRPFRSNFTWGEISALANHNNSFLLNNYPIPTTNNHLDHPSTNYIYNNHPLLGDQNMSLFNSSFSGFQGENYLISNIFQQPMNNNIGTLGANLNPIYDQVNILESSKLDNGQDIYNNGTNNTNNDQEDLASAAKQFLCPNPISTPNFDQFNQMNDNVGGSSLMVANHGQVQTNHGEPLGVGDNFGEPSNYNNNGDLFAIINGNMDKPPQEGNNNQGFGNYLFNVVLDNDYNDDLGDNFNIGVIEDNFNGYIEQGVFLNYDDVVDNHVVKEANSSNLNNIPSEQVFVGNNIPMNVFPEQNDNHQQEMPNFDFASGSPFGLQDWAWKNLDDFSKDGIDDLAAFFSSCDSNDISNNQLP